MKKDIIYKFLFCLLAFLIFTTSCSNSPVEEKTPVSKDEMNKRVLTKPQSNYQDTMKIEYASAVFYHPDSLQLQKIKEITDERIFDGQMHEYFFQMRNARIVLKKDWPGVKIIEGKNIRFLKFIRKERDPVIIDLDTKNDTYGLFLFQPRKEPHFADMMNIDTELPFYFSKEYKNR